MMIPSSLPPALASAEHPNTQARSISSPDRQTSGGRPAARTDQNRKKQTTAQPMMRGAVRPGGVRYGPPLQRLGRCSQDWRRLEGRQEERPVQGGKAGRPGGWTDRRERRAERSGSWHFLLPVNLNDAGSRSPNPSRDPGQPDSDKHAPSRPWRRPRRARLRGAGPPAEIRVDVGALSKSNCHDPRDLGPAGLTLPPHVCEC